MDESTRLALGYIQSYLWGSVALVWGAGFWRFLGKERLFLLEKASTVDAQITQADFASRLKSQRMFSVDVQRPGANTMTNIRYPLPDGITVDDIECLRAYLREHPGLALTRANLTPQYAGRPLSAPKFQILLHWMIRRGYAIQSPDGSMRLVGGYGKWLFGLQ